MPTFLRFFLIVLLMPCAEARAEAWRLAYELKGSRVEIDEQSIEKSGPQITWRERQVMLPPVSEPNSLRMVREIQWRKQADCRKQQVKILSHAAFSEDDALVGYEGVRPSKAIISPFPRLTLPERKSIEALCGRATSDNHLSEPARDGPTVPSAGQDLMPIIPR